MTANEQSTARERRTIYVVAGIVVLVLLLVALLTYRSKEATQTADAKANQYIAALSAAGAPTPSKDMVVHVLGDDGGALCDDPAGGLRRGILFDRLMNGAAGPGMRPVIADPRVVRGQLLALRIYCPDQLPDFQQLADELKLDDVVKG